MSKNSTKPTPGPWAIKRIREIFKDSISLVKSLRQIPGVKKLL